MGEIIAVVLGVLLIVVAIAAIAAIPAALFWVCWGAVAVEVFHAPPLSFWQAWALLILIGFIGKTLVRVRIGKKS